MKQVIFSLALVLALPLWAATADHSQFDVLKQNFTSLEAVTEACVGCHNQAEDQLHKSIHWQWQLDDSTQAAIGKLHIVNGYYNNVGSNAAECGSCHIGFGLSASTLTSIDTGPVDCLICHDTTGDYFFEKFHQDGAECTLCHDDRGKANQARVDSEGPRYTSTLTEMVLSVGDTSIETCGSCHFYDGGADGAKHGDLDSGLVNATVAQDVHMSKEGAGLECSDCHQSNNHEFEGSRYSGKSPLDTEPVSALEGSRATCVSCHGNRPMKDEKLNDHTDVVACQTCHIPRYARNGIATKTNWDWSAAGILDRKQRPFSQYDSNGNVVYDSAKGAMAYGQALLPSYAWHDGTYQRTRVGDPVAEGMAITAPTSEQSGRIFPFHTFTSKLPYDVDNEILLPMQLTGRDRSALWNGYDWGAAIDAATNTYNMNYSGNFDFITTLTYSGLNHGVAPASDALTCIECHQKDGRMAKVAGVYLPGAMQNGWLDRYAWLIVLLTIAAVLGHGLLRWIFARRRS
ncbi:tetrathionate reductase family octaheme c-type cytochrome [Salinibius halmophilus]|uniref:tetrathionate reductase family octaheme c-type cytochrome n=1 Tax=Salinibius halmophilus TaxID=1853216 RepID=UPI000E670432|nr:tetrathionate reductase family octaheme c-type cytochrome [Salinibius halmophilus]